MKLITLVLSKLSNTMKLVGGIALVGMMLLTVVDVIGRFFKTPDFRVR